jgi:DNA repair protein RecO
MSHHIYHTRGLILGSVATRESNKYYRIFTEELGLVGATAQAVRKLSSKLRYTLQDFSWINVDLVHGREVWRITSAVPEEVAPIHHGEIFLENRVLLARVCALVARLVHGEEQNKILFKELSVITEFLRAEIVPSFLHSSFETLATMRVLAHLGYDNFELYKDFVQNREWSQNTLMSFENVRLPALRDVNNVLRETHL